jgi:hypothetical protein
MEEKIQDAVALFRRSGCLRDDELFEMLVLRGTPPRIAARLVEFLPMAYCRVVLQGSARFADTYRRVLPTGEISQERELASEPVWEAVAAYARKEAASGVAEHEILAIAEHSAEYRAATELVTNSGSTLGDIAFTPVVLTWPEDGPSLATPEFARKK